MFHGNINFDLEFVCHYQNEEMGHDDYLFQNELSGLYVVVHPKERYFEFFSKLEADRLVRACNNQLQGSTPSKDKAERTYMLHDYDTIHDQMMLAPIFSIYEADEVPAQIFESTRDAELEIKTIEHGVNDVGEETVDYLITFTRSIRNFFWAGLLDKPIVQHVSTIETPFACSGYEEFWEYDVGEED